MSQHFDSLKPGDVVEVKGPIEKLRYTPNMKRHIGMRKVNKFLEYEKAGKSFNAEVHYRMDCRNLDFLLHAVRYHDIDQIGSCFKNDVFDPYGYDPSDYYDEIGGW